MTSRSSRGSCTAAFCLILTMVASLALAISWFAPLPGPVFLTSSATLRSVLSSVRSTPMGMPDEPTSRCGRPARTR